jgi:hypothetical protein
MDTVQQAAQVLAEHRYVGTSPRPGWMCANHNPPFFAEQFIDVSIHLAHALADAGLLAVREKPTALDHLAPGDRIWLDEAWREVENIIIMRNDDIKVVVIEPPPDRPRWFTAPAALLVRRAER